MRNMGIKILVVLIGVVAIPLISFAQIDLNTSYSLGSELGVEMIPEFPDPNQEVSVALTLYTDNLDTATISWYVNGKLVDKGIGMKNFSFKVGSSGVGTKLDIKVNLASGASFTKSISINPASVDILWESNSYTPPFYKGKALHPKQGLLKLVAMPEFFRGGKKVPPESLVYKWTNGLDVLVDQSGYGKNTVIIYGSILGRQENIELLVTDPSSNMVAKAFLNIGTVSPEIVFYENNSYYGQIFNQALNGSYDLKGDEIQVIASPYFFSNESLGSIKYNWMINSVDATDINNSRTVIFRKPEGESGQSRISLNIENLSKVLQQADSSLTIKFDN